MKIHTAKSKTALGAKNQLLRRGLINLYMCVCAVEGFSHDTVITWPASQAVAAQHST